MRLKNAEQKERERIAAISDDKGDYAHPVFGEGPKVARVMFIGEAPGGEEAKLLHPFVGKAGRQLDEMLMKAEIDRSLVYVTNTVKYRPVKRKEKTISNRTPAASEVKAGLEMLKTEIEEIAPKYIVTLGNTPLSAVCMIFGMEKTTVGAIHGKRIELPNGSALMPQYHPASVIYNRTLADVLQNDLVQLGKAVNEAEQDEKSNEEII